MQLPQPPTKAIRNAVLTEANPSHSFSIHAMNKMHSSDRFLPNKNKNTVGRFGSEAASKVFR